MAPLARLELSPWPTVVSDLRFISDYFRKTDMLIPPVAGHRMGLRGLRDRLRRPPGVPAPRLPPHPTALQASAPLQVLPPGAQAPPPLVVRHHGHHHDAVLHHHRLP